MKKFLFALFAAALFAANLFSLEVPTLTGPVMDLAGIMDEDSRDDLEDFLLQVDRSSSAQIAVLTIPSLEGEPLEEYAIKVAREWQLGNAEDNKGVLLLVAYEERKIRIEVGYGAEGDLTDAKCGLIIRNVIAPEFKGSDYSEGIVKGATAIAGIVAPEAGGERVAIEDDDADPASAIAVLIFFALYFFMFTGSLSTKFRALQWLPWAAWFMRKARGPRTGSQRFYDEYYGGHLRSTGFGGGGFSSGGGFSGGGGGFGGGGASGGW